MRMKSVFTALAGTAMAIALSGAATAQEYTFKLHHLLGAKAPAQTQMLEPWAKAVEENSGGRVKIEIFPAMTLGGRPPELIQQARDGVVDIVWTVNGYTPGLFPRTEVFELPTVYKNDPKAANLAMFDMFDDLKDDYAGRRGDVPACPRRSGDPHARQAMCTAPPIWQARRCASRPAPGPG